MGLSYTPMPLVTVEYVYQSNNLYRKGKNHQIGATVRYQLGLPLAQQCDPTQVARLRSLSGQLLAPVSRQYDRGLSYHPAAATLSKAVANPAAPAGFPSGGRTHPAPQPSWSPTAPDPNDPD